METIVRNRKYYLGLDGLRAIAALIVVLFHLNAKIFFFGWIGVDLFFVLSGFLITNLIVQNLNSHNFIKNFYIRRSLRIFPLYFIVTVPILLFLLILNKTNIFEFLSYITYTQNFYEVNSRSYLPLLGHTWSLAIEEQFYLFYPFIFLIFKFDRNRIRTLFSLILISVVFRFIFSFQGYSVYWQSTLLFSRMDSLLIGGLLVLLVEYYNFSRQRLNQIFNVIIILSTISLIFLYIYIGDYSLINSIKSFGNYGLETSHLSHLKFTLLSFIFVSIIGKISYSTSDKSQKVILVLENQTFKYLGKISYGIYFYHWVILSIYIYLKKSKYLNTDIHFIWDYVIVISLTIIMSHYSFKYLESYFLRFKKVYGY